MDIQHFRSALCFQLLLLPGPLAQQTFFSTHTGLLTATFLLIWEEVETLMSFVFFQMASYDFLLFVYSAGTDLSCGTRDLVPWP